MKKGIFSLLFLISVFFCISDVKAEENKVYWKLESTRDEQFNWRDGGQLKKYLEEYKDSSRIDGFQYADIRKIVFNNGEKVTDCVGEYDISKADDGSVMVCLKKEGTSENMYIQYDGILYFNENSAAIFRDMAGVTSIEGLENVNTSEVKDMSYMFHMNNILPTLDLSSFDTSNVTDMRMMFWSTAHLKSLNVSSFNTSNVRYMNSMFEGASELTSLDLSSFDTSKVISMSSMFQYDSSLEELDLSNFDTSKVENMACMFSYTLNLKRIYVSQKWNTSSVTTSNSMFADSKSLVGSDGTIYDKAHLDSEYARIDRKDTPGYLSVKNPITSIVVNKTNLSLQIGQTEKIIVTINPSNTMDSKELIWSSNNEKVATVDANGNVKAIGGGTAIVTITAANGKTTSITVNVLTSITSIKIDQIALTVFVGKKGKLTATINPNYTTDSKVLSWTSSNKKVATVDNNGNVKGIKAGTATITVKTVNGKTASINVMVKNQVPIKSVKLNKKTLKVSIGKSTTVKATINPSNTTDSKTLTWSSSNKKIATVDANGKITAVNAGTATITVKTSNGKKATVKVTVPKINAKKATITAITNQIQTGSYLKPGVEVKLNGKVLKRGTDYKVIYKNHKNAGKAIVTVKFKGNYTGVKTTSFKIIPKKVSIKNPTTAKKSITIKYSKVNGAKTYQIAYRVKGTDTWKYVTSKTTSKKISKLTGGLEYEVMVRAGVKIGKTTYGEWSDVKTIIVK